jgi:hypothetical protein
VAEEDEMKKYTIIVVACAVATLVAGAVMAQDSGGQKSLSSSMNVYVFPEKGQDASTQSQEEAACYGWAVDQTGTDPFDLMKQAQQQQAQTDAATQQAQHAADGAGARGAVGGAAAGALIGSLDGNAGRGAAWGAAIGGIAARRRGKQAEAQATQQVQQQGQQAQAATAEQIENFKKAFSVCLEAKNYMVKY